MKHISRVRALWGGLLALALVATGCKKELDDYYTLQGPQYPTLLTTNSLGNATKYAVGEVVTFELQFAQQTDPIKQIVILQKVEPARDSAVVQTIAYAPAYSRIKRTDTLVVRYTVPPGDNKSLVRVDARVDSQNGQSKVRSFYFRLAEATPTIVINSGPVNVTVPTATATSAPGDIIRYNVTLNKGGIGSAPLPPATTAVPAGILYKDIDSLVVYAKFGTAPERRVVRTKPAYPSTVANGSELTTNVDVPLPAGSAGQPVTLRFEVKVRTPASAASVTAAPYTPAAATPFAAVRTATLTYTGSTGGDLAAYDLTTFAAVPAAGPATSKDLVISSTASNAVQFRTLSTGTRLVRSTSAVYSAATLSSIRQTYNATAAAAQVTTLDNVVVGDVIILKLRGADQYAVVQVTGINRTSTTDVTVNFNLQAL